MIMRSYQEFPTLPQSSKQTEENCQNITTPCWIPQASTIIESISRDLPICDTFEKYQCMLATIKAAKYASQDICLRSCKAEGYKILTRTGDIEPFTKVK